MKRKDEFLYFIPAKALQNINNPESCSLRCKIHLAILRDQEFNDLHSVELVPMPYRQIYIQAMQFNSDRLGYDVVGEIDC